MAQPSSGWALSEAASFEAATGSALTMADLGSHAALFATEFAPPFTRFLNAHVALLVSGKNGLSRIIDSR
jgi:hypothetical protein